MSALFPSVDMVDVLLSLNVHPGQEVLSYCCSSTTTRLHHRPARDLHRPGVDVGKGKGRCGASIQCAKDQDRDWVFALDIGHLQSIQAAIDRDVRPGILGKLVKVALVPRALCGEAGENGGVLVDQPEAVLACVKADAGAEVLILH